jgi:hypothetical protein
MSANRSELLTLFRTRPRALRGVKRICIRDDFDCLWYDAVHVTKVYHPLLADIPAITNFSMIIDIDSMLD